VVKGVTTALLSIPGIDTVPVVAAVVVVVDNKLPLLLELLLPEPLPLLPELL